MEAKVKIITDSTCDLPKTLLDELDIEVIPLFVTLNGVTYKDMLEIEPSKMFKLIEECKELPKTSAIMPIDFINTFKKYVELGQEVIYLGLGSDLSSTYFNAYNAAQEFEGKVQIVDSKNLSSAIGLQLLKLVELRDKGMSAKEMKKEIEHIVFKTECSFAVDTMQYLHKGGRCSGITYFAGKLLRIHPIIKMKDGRLKVHKTPRGKMFKALDVMIEEFKDQYFAGNVDLGKVMITHACTEEYCKYIYDKLVEFLDPSVIITTTAGCVISSHCGPKCIGILYIRK